MFVKLSAVFENQKIINKIEKTSKKIRIHPAPMLPVIVKSRLILDIFQYEKNTLQNQLVDEKIGKDNKKVPNLSKNIIVKLDFIITDKLSIYRVRWST